MWVYFKHLKAKWNKCRWIPDEFAPWWEAYTFHVSIDQFVKPFPSHLQVNVPFHKDQFSSVHLQDSVWALRKANVLSTLSLRSFPGIAFGNWSHTQHACMYACTHTHTHAYTHACMYVCAHTHTHAGTHTHTHRIAHNKVNIKKGLWPVIYPTK